LRVNRGRSPVAAIVCLAACVAAVTSAAPAHGADQYVIFGAGGRACGSWLQARNQTLPDRAVLQSWVLGYITSVNANLLTSGRDVTGGANADALFSWIDSYCATHPLDSIARAAGALLDSMLVKNKAR
jgi:hypothetical protein